MEGYSDESAEYAHQATHEEIESRVRHGDQCIVEKTKQPISLCESIVRLSEYDKLKTVRVSKIGARQIVYMRSARRRALTANRGPSGRRPDGSSYYGFVMISPVYTASNALPGTALS